MRFLAVLLLFVATACAREGGLAVDATPVPIITAQPEATEAPATVEPSPTATASASPTPSATPAASSAACRNSVDASCGAFRFDPAPPEDDPVAVKVEYSPENPKAGDTVTFTLTGADPDSKVVLLGTYRFGRGQSAVVVDDAPDRCARAYGPWDPPSGARGSAKKTVRHTYRDAGTFEADFTFYSRSYTAAEHPWPNEAPGDNNSRCVDPLSSSGKAEVTVTVSE